MVSSKTIDTVSARLRIFYSGRFTAEQGMALAHFFDDRPEMDDTAFEAAIRRHLSSWEAHDGSVNPPGRFPPTPADLEGHLHNLLMERKRNQQFTLDQERRQESDAPYQRAMASKTWRDEFDKSSAIRAALVAKYRLDFKKPLHMEILMKTLTQGMKTRKDHGEIGLPDVTEALLIAHVVVEKMKALHAPKT